MPACTARHEDDVIADRFAVQGALGSGGMGIVLRATDLETGEVVALKVPRRGRSRRHRVQLLEEGVALQTVRHPNVVRGLCCGLSRHGRAYLAMELVEGSAVSRWIAERGVLAPSAVARIVRETGSALGCLHAHGLVHRDIKPSNLLVRDADGSTVLIDFGLALVRGPGPAEDSARYTPGESGTVLGTPAYLSPENVRHGRTCPASDQFALAISAYEMLTGRLPWRRRGATATVAAILMDEAPTASAVVPTLPRRVDAVLARALRKEPSERFEDVGTFADALGEALAG